jgi:hypothetical protein
MLTILQGIDVALGVTMTLVIVRSTAAEVRKFWNN